jgi:hypothetical protein
LAAPLQLLIDRLEQAAKVLRRLLPDLRTWLQSLLGAWGAAGAAAVRGAALGPAQAQPAPAVSPAQTVVSPPGGAAAVPDGPRALVQTNPTVLLGPKRVSGCARLESKPEQTDTVALVALVAGFVPRGVAPRRTVGIRPPDWSRECGDKP